MYIREAELGARKKKYKSMANEGKKLPATWKSFAGLGEEEKKEATLLTHMCVLEEDDDDRYLVQIGRGARGDRSPNGVRVQSGRTSAQRATSEDHF